MMLFLDCHTCHILVTEAAMSERSLSLCLFLPGAEVLGIFFFLNVYFSREAFDKMKGVLLVWHLGTLREFLPLISLKCATAAAEEVAALGLFLECGIRGLGCAGLVAALHQPLFYFGL